MISVDFSKVIPDKVEELSKEFCSGLFRSVVSKTKMQVSQLLLNDSVRSLVFQVFYHKLKVLFAAHSRISDHFVKRSPNHSPQQRIFNQVKIFLEVLERNVIDRNLTKGEVFEV